MGEAGAVRFGIFFELSVPPPYDGAAERLVYENALEQAILADELGFDWVWAVEHHFLEGYSHCSAPELFLTAVAARTRADPRRPRRRRVRAGDEPPGARRRAGRGARHPLRRAAGAGHGPVVDVDRAGRLRRRSGHDQADVGRVRPRAAEDVVGRAVQPRGPRAGGCPSGGCCRRRCRIRTRRCGSPSPRPAPSSTPPTAASAASASPRCRSPSRSGAPPSTAGGSSCAIRSAGSTTR